MAGGFEEESWVWWTLRLERLVTYRNRGRRVRMPAYRCMRVFDSHGFRRNSALMFDTVNVCRIYSPESSQ